MVFCNCEKLKDEIKEDYHIQNINEKNTDDIDYRNVEFGIYFVNHAESGYETYPVYKLDFCPFCGKKIK